MASTVTIYYNPNCSKCRMVKEIAQQQQVSFDIVEYLQSPLAEEEIRSLLRKLKVPASDLLRSSDSLYKELQIDKKILDENEIISLIAKYPKLMQRPIVVKGDKAIIARPPEKIFDILN